MDALRSHLRPESAQFSGVDPFCIGGAKIDPATREVIIGGEKERIQQQPLRVLMLLHRNASQLVTRDEIIDQCWDRRIISDDVINRAILILRRLALRAGGFRIETIPRAGYRLVEQQSANRGQGRLALVIAALLIAMVGAASYLRQVSSAAALPKIRVLPIKVSGGGFASAAVGTRIERAIIDALHESGSIVVAAGKGDLAVSTQISASAGKTRVDFAVLAGPQRTAVISRNFERTAAQSNDMEEEVGAAVVETIAATADLLTLDARFADPAFVSRMVATRMAVAQGDALKSYQMAVRTVHDYPDSVAAELTLAALAGATLESFTVPERRAHVRTARSILERRQSYAPKFGDYGHAWCLLRPRSWLSACEEKLRETLRESGTANSSGQRLSELVADVGRLDEALQLARVTAAKNPYSAPDTGILLQLLEIGGRHREAEAVYAQAVRKWPANWSLRWNRIMGLAARGDFAALESFAGTIADAEFTFDARVLKSALAAFRMRDVPGIVRACAHENLRGSTRQTCVAALAAAGEIDRSLAIGFELYPKQVGRNASEDEELWLRRPAYFSVSFLSAPAGAPLRRDPRFLELAAQTGLLRYWRGGSLPDFCLEQRPEPVCAQLRKR